MSAKLVLFVDKDYLIPVVSKPNGDLDKFSYAKDCRLWLYFYDSPHKVGVDFGRECKAGYESEKPGYLGDFWQKLEENAVYETKYGNLSYCNLLEHSDILQILKKEYERCTGDDDHHIPTVFIFSNNISSKSRNAFLSYMKEKGFDIISYSISINDLTADYLLFVSRTSLEPQFGDKIIFLQSSGKNLLMSYTTFDGDRFLEGEQPKIIENSGDSPVKRALVEFVVKKVDEQNGFLSEEKRRREYNYQMQFVDEWLSKKTNEVSFTIDNFHYSSDPEITYSCIVNCSFLRSVQETAIKFLLDAIEYYKNQHIKNDLLQVVLFGDAFSDDLFQEKVTKTLGDSRKVIYLSPYELQEVLGIYPKRNSKLSESFTQFAQITREKEQASEAIIEWIKSAEKIRLLLSDVTDLQKEYDESVDDFLNLFTKQQKTATDALKYSQFDKADSAIDSLNDDMAKIDTTNRQIDKLVERSESYHSLYVKASKFEGAKKIIDSIRDKLEKIRVKRDIFNHNVNTLRKTKSDIMHFRDNYDLYQKKLAEFKKEKSHFLRLSLHDEMKTLTMEELPVVDVDEFRIILHAEIKKTGFLFSKKQILVVKIQLEKNSKLPCNCVLAISSEPLVKINRNKDIYTEDFEKGTGDTIEREYKLPLPNCPKAQRLNLYFWPHEDEFISINTFRVNRCSIKL